MERNDWFKWYDTKVRCISELDAERYFLHQVPVTLHEFPNTVVHCKTKEEYNDLMETYEKGGWNTVGFRNTFNEPEGLFVECKQGWIEWYRNNRNDTEITFQEFIERQLNWDEKKERLWGLIEEPSADGWCERDVSIETISHPEQLPQAKGRIKVSDIYNKKIDESQDLNDYSTLPFITYHHTFMIQDSCYAEGKYSTPLEKVRNAFLSKREKQLRKHGFKNNDGTWTCSARDAYLEQLMNNDKDCFKDVITELESK